MQSCPTKQVLIALLAVSCSVFAQDDEVVGPGKSIGFEYTVRLDDGTVVDTNVDGEPFVYVHGSEDLLPALEAALLGMNVEERKSIHLTPGEAYGEADPDAFREVPVERVPESARRVGAMLRSQEFPDGVTVQEVRDDVVVLNLNHPLAGQALTFDVRILSID